jgi:peptidoglycan/LPS O-acetylase OafA/YrhL
MIVCLATFLIIGFLVKIKNFQELKINRILGNRLFSFIGRISYSLYLWHYFIDFLTHKEFLIETKDKSFFLITTFKIITSVFVASLSYYIIEQPF